MVNSKELRIEHYLLQLDRELRPLTVSQRAEIITEIKSHITGVLEKDPTRDIENILNGLGAPKAVAEPYLTSKGLKSASPPRTGRWLKWLAVGTVAFFAFIFIAGLSAIWYLSPLVQVDESQGRIRLLGGMIDVNEKLGHVKLGGLEINDAMKVGFETGGEEDLTNQEIKMIKIPFNTARLNIEPDPGKLMRWKCSASTKQSPKAEVVAGVLSLNLDALDLAKCTIALPRGIASDFKGVNGQMEISVPGDPMNISLVNGKVNIRLDPNLIYDFQVKVKNGLQDFFPRSVKANAIKMKVDVVNGLVKKE